ncbi:MAG TPA: hypothetical protein PL149_08540, partial [Candidatus Kapabacteria bacterium]|nr:hypothetical protein [Candidatus Kapabacteria bacterium]
MKISLKYTVVYLFWLCFLSQIAFGSQFTYQKLVPSVRFPEQYEIGMIRFSGNSYFSESQLRNIIQTRETN